MEDETKMSEEESSQLHESESNDDESDSNSVDEEIKLNQNFICVLQKIAAENKNYDDYILLLDISHDLNDLEKIRQSISLFQQEFPLSPTIWQRYLKVETSLAHSDEEKKKLQMLFQRALADYYSIELAIDYAGLAASCNNEMATEIWNDLLPAYGYEFTKGRLIWLAWREDYLRRETNLDEEKFKKIVKRYKEELLLPLNDMKVTYAEFREFLDKHNTFKNIDRNSIEEEVKNTRKIHQKVLSHEQKLKKIDEKAHRDRIRAFKNYIESLAEDLEEEYVQVLYERMITSCCLNESAWMDYLHYIENRPKDWAPLETNKSKIFRQTELDIINRALRNCSWSADLYVKKMRLLEINKKPREEVQQTLEKACTIQYKSSDPLVKIWIEYLSYLIRTTNYEDEKQKEILRSNFDLAWNSLGWTFGSLADCDCEILKLWGHAEFTILNDQNQGIRLWNTVMESNENYKKVALWIEFTQLEQQHRGIDAARAILKRAIKVHDLDDLQGMASFWIRFERLHGSLLHFTFCQEACEKAFIFYRKRVVKEKYKYDIKEEEDLPRGNKRKAEDYPYENKKKKHTPMTSETTTTVSKEEFQKLSISKKAEKEDVSEKGERNGEIDESKDNIRVFLSNLSYNITVEELRKGFPEISITNFEMIMSKEGKSLGYGYAELANATHVELALGLDRRLLANRPVFISRCERDRTQRQGFKYSTKVEPNKIFIKSLSFESKAADLYKKFSEIGAIKDIRIVTKKNGQSKGIAYVEFENEKSASHAVLKFNDTEFMGRCISVAISSPPPLEKHDRFQAQSNVPVYKPAIRTAPESRLAFVPLSVQKATINKNLAITSAPKSNSDFRKMLLKK